MMFEIRFDQHLPAASCRAGDHGGCITIGEFHQGFCASGSFWAQRDDIGQSQACVDQLLAHGGATSAAITTVFDLAQANVVGLWPMFLHGEQVHSYNQMLCLDDRRPTSVAELLDLIPPESLLTEDDLAFFGDPLRMLGGWMFGNAGRGLSTPPVFADTLGMTGRAK